MHLSLNLPVSTLAMSWAQAGQSIGSGAVHIALLMVLIILTYSAEHFVPRAFYGGIGLLRYCPVVLRLLGGHIERWGATYVTDDAAAEDATGQRIKGKTRLLPAQIDGFYSGCIGLERPRDKRELWGVSELITVLCLWKFRVAWSDHGKSPRQMRLYGRFTRNGFVAGRWFDTNQHTDHKGTFFVALNYNKTEGMGCWIGPAEDRKGRIRIYPWVWTKVVERSSPLALVGPPASEEAAG